MRLLASLLIALVLFALGPPSVDACTTFLLKTDGGLRIGKSYDWHTADGLVVWNPAGLAKQALLLAPGDKPARWTAQHASLTFNQYGREMPNGGMNTAGLVVEIMWLDSTVYPATDDRPALGELQWIQYQLDQAATIDDVVRLAKAVRVRSTYGKVHYLACDKAGACAAIEYVDGELEIRVGDDLPVPTLTNDTYDDSLDRLGYHRGFGGTNPLPLGKGSLKRFVRASARAKAAAERPPRDLTAATFKVLNSVRVKGYTKWQIVYDPETLEVAFRTARTESIKRLSIARLSTQCSRPALALDMDHGEAGDATNQLTAWSPAANRKLLELSLKPMLDAKTIPSEAPDLLTRYGGSARCEPSAMMCATKSGEPRPCENSQAPPPLTPGRTEVGSE